ncbi:MAG: ABC transporter permease [Acidimicrobiia bacterium]|nr:ABC transporter permease [bacterium]MXX01649.1 ABC transporter permease [Acidimicrobiia bacterium]MXX44583.1 ABC transporter permease [Acidimicrobiia bacterium]MXY74399.1 ABC transporter permease [Acidimicrobiia bacterium]MYA40046.1 ABC transporter permease [Acidimicrobiia bacterium]
MGSYIARRLIALVPILIGVTMVAFLVSRGLPGDPARLYAGMQASEGEVQAIRVSLGLDKPLYHQYWIYMQGLIQGDLGFSLRTGFPVAEDIRNRLPATVEMVIFALAFALSVALPLGVWAAVRRGKLVDRFSRFISTLGVAIPDFWAALILVMIFFVFLGWAPAPVGRLDLGASPPDGTGFYLLDSVVRGEWGTFTNALGHIILPMISLGFPAIAPITRLTRNATLSVLQSDYIAFGRASGLRGAPLYLKYVLRNSLPGAITMTGLISGYMIGGAVLIERVFSWPGVGLYAYNSLERTDHAAIQGVVLLSAVTYLLVFLVVDLLQSIVDPRVRLK